MGKEREHVRSRNRDDINVKSSRVPGYVGKELIEFREEGHSRYQGITCFIPRC